MLMGQLGSGKTFLSSKLVDELNAKKLSLGEPVYRLAESALGRTIDKSKHGDREILTLVGTTWGRKGETVPVNIAEKLVQNWFGRHGYEDMWVDDLSRRVEAIHSTTPLVIDDVRFQNEFTRLRDELHFVPTCVLCSDSTRSKRLVLRGDSYLPSHDLHDSEVLSAKISKWALRHDLMPAVWNDEWVPKPEGAWIYSLPDWTQAVKSQTLTYDARKIDQFFAEVLSP